MYCVSALSQFEKLVEFSLQCVILSTTLTVLSIVCCWCVKSLGKLLEVLKKLS